MGARVGLGRAGSPVGRAGDGQRRKAAQGAGILIIVYGQHRGTGRGSCGLCLEAQRLRLAEGSESEVIEGHLIAHERAARAAAHKLHAGGQLRSEGVGCCGHLAVTSQLILVAEDIASHKGSRLLERDGRRHVESRRLVDGAGRSAFLGAVAHAPPGKRVPDSAMVLALVQQRVGGQNSITRVEEARLAGLELHALHYQLQGDVVAAGAGPVIQVGFDGALLLDDIPGHVPERRAPDFANGVHFRVAREVGVGERVGAEGCRVGVAADAPAGWGLAHGVGAHGPGVGAIGELGRGPVGGQHQGQVVAPALAALLGIGQAAAVGRAAGEAGAHAVAVLVHHDAVVEIAVELRPGIIARQGHIHARGYLSNQRSPVGLRNHDRRNGDRIIAATHYDRRPGHIINHNSSDGSGQLRIFHLYREGAGAPVQHGNLARERSAAIGTASQAGNGAAAGIGEQTQLARNRAEGGEAVIDAETAFHGRVIARYGSRRCYHNGVGRRYAIPQVHLHAAARAVGWGVKVGIVGAATVLGLGLHVVAAPATAAQVIGLEVASGLRKPVLIGHVVHDVVPVKQVHHGSVAVNNHAGRSREIGRINEAERRSRRL